MGFPLRDALRRLCVEIGWSYAVFWKAVGFHHQMHLVWEDGYCGQAPGTLGIEAFNLLVKEHGMARKLSNDQLAELGSQAKDSVHLLVNRTMISQVHVVGDGIVGEAAFTGNYQWILRDAFNSYGTSSKVVAEMNYQFGAGIQTIVIVPVLPYGVLQLGSTQTVMENTGFVIFVRSLFSQLDSRPGDFLSDTTEKSLSPRDQTHSSIVMGRNCAPISTSISDLPCSLSSKLTGKMPSITSEFISSTDSVKSIAISSSTLVNPDISSSSIKPAHYSTRQLIGQPVGPDVIYSKHDLSFSQQALPHDMKFETQIQSSTVNTDFASCSLMSLEEPLLFMPDTRSLEFAKDAACALDDTEAVQQKHHSCDNPILPEDSNTVSLHGSIKLSDRQNNIGRFTSTPEGTNKVIRASSGNLSNAETVEILQDKYHISGDEQQNQSSFRQNTQPVSNAEGERHGNNSVQASATPSGSDMQGSCHGFLAGTLQEHGLWNSNPFEHDQKIHTVDNEANDSCSIMSLQSVKDKNGHKIPCMPMEKTSTLPLGQTSGSDLFELLDPQFQQICGSLDNALASRVDANAQRLDADASILSNFSDALPVINSVADEFSHSGIFSVADSDQLLDAVISNANLGAKHGSDDTLSCKTSLTFVHSSPCYDGSSNHGLVTLSEAKLDELSSLPPVPVKNEIADLSNNVRPPSFLAKAEECSHSQSTVHKSQIRLWVESGQSMTCDSMSTSNSKKLDITGKPNRKRSRPGESPRPRPKDRQMIQDRIKELREIVPNGAKCSIDALLEKTIKHMFFLQSVTKNADKLKDTGESKIIGEEGGLLLKDYFEGGATWAFEVGTQSMVCPIIVEDLNPPRQMLVEMLCQERGFFLEIADFIRGLGLTILKGVMETRKDKIWARFAVEANRDTTRMEIFLSLVHLLEPTARSSIVPQNINNINMPNNILHQPSIPATGLSDCTQ
ncbi:transcription factor LHW-like isoform X2 [Typha angustifolia]|uniref:transcription factor LHW-like isoform X2 n=1 Tax=Typha angustifolia TaxID=59011 RepID=UPI003C2B7FDF